MMILRISPGRIYVSLVFGVTGWWLNQTHLKNMQKSNWKSSSPIFGVKIPKIFELQPPK